MIIKNPIVKSGLIVYTFWYILLYIAFALVWRYGPWWVVEDYPLSLAAMALGCAAGLAGTVGVQAFRLHGREAEVAAGAVSRGAKASLGGLPQVPGTERHPKPVAFHSALHARFWWKLVAREFPLHAAAIEAVAAVMASRPTLPASPVPGGHGGRSLFEHSLGVADTMVKMARTWRYEGQKDKQGRVRVKLRDTATGFHAFKRQDVGLLALTALAHDLGKVACYEPTGERDGRVDRVREVLPNHDSEGAGMLRLMPEVMALPYQERRALLLAVGYYHHAGSISNADAITDRMRSLTELLIAADVATGKAEGGVSEANVEDEAEDAEAQEPAAATVSVSRIAGPANITIGAGGTEPEANAVADEAQPDDLPFELSLLYRMLADPSAIGRNVPDRTKRVGYKWGGKLWLMDEAVKGQAARIAKMSSEAQVVELLGIGAGEGNGNATPFTARLLTQLHERGLLLVDWGDGELSPSRAMFRVRSPKMKNVVGGFFVVPADITVSTARRPDDGEMEIVSPLWGPGSVRRKKAPAPDPLSQTGEREPGDDVGDAANLQATSMRAASVSADYDAALPPDAQDGSMAESDSAPAGDEDALTLDAACALFLQVFGDAVRIIPDKKNIGGSLVVVSRDDAPAAVDRLVAMLEKLEGDGVDITPVKRMIDASGALQRLVFAAPAGYRAPAPRNGVTESAAP